VLWDHSLANTKTPVGVIIKGRFRRKGRAIILWKMLPHWWDSAPGHCRRLVLDQKPDQTHIRPLTPDPNIFREGMLSEAVRKNAGEANSCEQSADDLSRRL
jgi:hypothetical protein